MKTHKLAIRCAVCRRLACALRVIAETGAAGQFQFSWLKLPAGWWLLEGQGHGISIVGNDLAYCAPHVRCPKCLRAPKPPKL